MHWREKKGFPKSVKFPPQLKQEETFPRNRSNPPPSHSVDLLSNTEKPWSARAREKWQAWLDLKGTDTLHAKRRYITLLHSIDPTLLCVSLPERPPPGFPRTGANEPICARCNCAAGCWEQVVQKGTGKPLVL